MEPLGCGGEPHGVGQFRRRVEDWGKDLDHHLCIENCQLWRERGREERDERREGMGQGGRQERWKAGRERGGKLQMKKLKISKAEKVVVYPLMGMWQYKCKN